MITFTETHQARFLELSRQKGRPSIEFKNLKAMKEEFDVPNDRFTYGHPDYFRRKENNA